MRPVKTSGLIWIQIVRHSEKYFYMLSAENFIQSAKCQGKWIYLKDFAAILWRETTFADRKLTF